MTDETKDEIVKRFAAGESFGVLAEAYGVTRNQIAGIVNRYGKPRGKQPAVAQSGGGRKPRIDRDRAVDFWRKGMSYDEIAADLGCKANWVREIILRDGLVRAQPRPATRTVDHGVVRSLRRKGLSQRKIAKLVGCTQTYVSRILSIPA